MANEVAGKMGGVLRHRLTVIVMLGCVALAGCAHEDSTGEASRRPTDADVCHETAPIAAGKLPRTLQLLGSNGNWFGADGLWTRLPTDYDAVRRKGGFFLKYPWVTLDDQKTTSRFGPPAVQAERIDGSGHAVAEFGGYATSDRLDFWPSSLLFSSRGCWMVTGKLQSTVVRFVVKI